MEREEWTEAFRILNQLAQPYGSSKQVTPPITGEGGGRGEGEQVGGRRGVCKGRSSRVVWPVPEKTALTRERERERERDRDNECQLGENRSGASMYF